MTGLLIALAVVAAVLLLARSKGSGKKSPKPDWRILYSPGMSGPVMQGAGWYFDFPTSPASHVHYVQWFKPPALGKSLRVRFAVTGGGFVPQEFPDGRPALVSLLLQRKGDNWQADARTKSYRWYSAQAVELAAGEFELTVPLDVSAWGDVYNGQDAAAFAATLADLDNIGLVFGSDGGRGHGVYAATPSRFTLLELV